MDHAVTATQNDILRAFQMDANAVRVQADELSEMLAKIVSRFFRKFWKYFK